MPDPTLTPGGVFISYAREDSEVARRMADALRAFGIEVWFDQQELRGGDTWDAKIRRQIRDCALFLPIISAHTQARREGYFRREWKLAVERTHDMAAGVPFLLPAVVDDTLESEALVPDELLRVQWTRLPKGVPTPQFVEQVKWLLASPGRPTESGRPRPTPSAGSAPPVPPARRSGRTWGAVAAMVMIASAGVAWLVMQQPKSPTAAPVPASPAAASLATAVPTQDAKSIAVLPFTNMSEDKGNAFFADGMQEDILTSLARLRELRVVSRTSVMEYRGTTKKIPQIARELGVAYVLEGSVQRAGNKVRVTGQLIRAATDEHVWAQSYDRDLSDVFAIQSELAQAIAGELAVALSPREQQLLARRPTDNTAAYDLFLKARQVDDGAYTTRADFRSVESLLTSAVELDPNFGLAWCELAELQAGFVAASIDTTPARVEKARAALGRAQALLPDSPEVARAQGVYYLFAVGDPARAREQFERLVLLQPNDPETRKWLSTSLLLQGHWKEAMEMQRLTTQLDPRNVGYAMGLVQSLWNGRRYDEALAEVRRIMALLPGRLRYEAMAVQIEADATGDLKAENLALEQLIARYPDAPEANAFRKVVARNRGDVQEFARLDQAESALQTPSSYDPDTLGALVAAEFYLQHGNPDWARQRLGSLPDRLRAQLELEPNNTQVLRSLARAESILGHPEEALRYLDRAAGIVPESMNAYVAPNFRINRARVFLQAGDYDRAMPELAWLLHHPTSVKINWLRPNGLLAPAKRDPRIEALLADPAVNTPLF